MYLEKKIIINLPSWWCYVWYQTDLWGTQKPHHFISPPSAVWLLLLISHQVRRKDPNSWLLQHRWQAEDDDPFYDSLLCVKLTIWRRHVVNRRRQYKQTRPTSGSSLPLLYHLLLTVSCHSNAMLSHNESSFQNPVRLLFQLYHYYKQPSF